MKLILTLSLTCTLFCSVEMLQCFNNTCSDCSEKCSDFYPTCLTANITATGFINTTQTVKMCSPIHLYGEATVSLNQGFLHITSNQLFCNIDGCNKQTLPVPRLLANGKQCPACSSFQDTVCNSTVACLGLEDQCFSGKTPLIGSINSTVNLKGCTTSNVCNSISQLLPSISELLPSINKQLPFNITLDVFDFMRFTCNTAPVPAASNTAWSIRLSLVTLLLGLTIIKLI